MDDVELLRAWRAGDRPAGERLVARHFRTVYGFFRNKIDGEVEDLVQRTFLHCLEAANAFRGESSFRTYLLAIARNELFGHYRARGVTVDPQSTALGLIDPGTRPSVIVDRRHEHRLLVRALRSLPLDDQILLELFYFEEMQGPDLAVVLAVPEGTVRTRLRRARALLEKRVAELEAEGEGARATTDDIDRWAGSLRDVIRREGLRR